MAWIQKLKIVVIWQASGMQKLELVQSQWNLDDKLLSANKREFFKWISMRFTIGVTNSVTIEVNNIVVLFILLLNSEL